MYWTDLHVDFFVQKLLICKHRQILTEQIITTENRQFSETLVHHLQPSFHSSRTQFYHVNEHEASDTLDLSLQSRSQVHLGGSRRHSAVNLDRATAMDGQTLPAHIVQLLGKLIILSVLKYPIF